MFRSSFRRNKPAECLYIRGGLACLGLSRSVSFLQGKPYRGASEVQYLDRTPRTPFSHFPRLVLLRRTHTSLTHTHNTFPGVAGLRDVDLVASHAYLTHTRTMLLQVWPGFVTSIHQHDAGVLLSMELSHKILRTDTVLDKMYEAHATTQRRNVSFEEECKRLLVGQIVLTRYSVSGRVRCFCRWRCAFDLEHSVAQI